MEGKELTARERGKLGPVAQADNETGFGSLTDADRRIILDILDW